METRFDFTYNFLIGAVSMARLAFEIDKKGIDATELEKLQHLSYVSGSIMLSIAALESESWNLLNYGPGHHLGSNGLDKEGAKLLSIVADSFEKKPVLERFNLILKLLKDNHLI